jgi:hypothetical protein
MAGHPEGALAEIGGGDVQLGEDGGTGWVRLHHVGQSVPRRGGSRCVRDLVVLLEHGELLGGDLHQLEPAVLVHAVPLLGEGAVDAVAIADGEGVPFEGNLSDELAICGAHGHRLLPVTIAGDRSSADASGRGEDPQRSEGEEDPTPSARRPRAAGTGARSGTRQHGETHVPRLRGSRSTPGRRGRSR